MVGNAVPFDTRNAPAEKNPSGNLNSDEAPSQLFHLTLRPADRGKKKQGQKYQHDNSQPGIAAGVPKITINNNHHIQEKNQGVVHPLAFRS